MGCTQSKIENEETIIRCKERKQLMKDAVTARNAFAAAHSAYTMSLKNTGAALSDYAHGEVESTTTTTTATTTNTLPSSAQQSYDSLFPPPPPLPDFAASPLQRAASMPELPLLKSETTKHSDPIMEEDSEEEIETPETNNYNLRHRSRKSSGGVKSGIVNEELSAAPSYDYFFPSMENVPGTSLDAERKGYEEMSKRGEAESEEVERLADLPPPPQQVVPAEAKRAVTTKAVPSLNLFQLFTELDDCFLKASESGHEVSKMLEANRLHYHSNFADNRGHIDHSARLMRVITWNRSFKGSLNPEEGKDDFDSEEHETHATVLDKMLAWEKKLYDEVKAAEQMKLEYQKKVDSLTKLKKRGTNTEAVERTQAIVSHLHTKYIVDMQSMDSTVSEINRLRDEQLYPKLVALVDRMATMWEAMRIHHENQTKIMRAFRSLDLSQSSKETSKHHHERTIQLWEVVRDWHSHFEKLTTHQKDYIKYLNGWLKLNLIPIDTNLREKVSSPQWAQKPPIHTLLLAWRDYLEKLPEELARTAILNFSAIVDTIVQYQIEEIKLMEKCKDTQNELERKNRHFQDWHSKYLQKRTPPDEMDPDRAQDKDLVAERQLVVEILKKRLEEEEAAYHKQCLQVREKSLTTLRIRLPELFRAMSEFSLACSDMYRSLRSISKTHNSNGSS